MSSVDGSGMDMGSNGLFRGSNMALARLYWYIIAGVVGCGCLLKGGRTIEEFARLVLHMNAIQLLILLTDHLQETKESQFLNIISYKSSERGVSDPRYRHCC